MVSVWSDTKARLKAGRCRRFSPIFFLMTLIKCWRREATALFVMPTIAIFMCNHKRLALGLWPTSPNSSKAGCTLKLIRRKAPWPRYGNGPFWAIGCCRGEPWRLRRKA